MHATDTPFVTLLYRSVSFILFFPLQYRICTSNCLHSISSHAAAELEKPSVSGYGQRRERRDRRDHGLR